LLRVVAHKHEIHGLWASRREDERLILVSVLVPGRKYLGTGLQVVFCEPTDSLQLLRHLHSIMLLHKRVRA